MKKKVIIANWKAHKTSQEAKDWLEKFLTVNIQQLTSNNKEVIVCPPFSLLSLVKNFIDTHTLPLHTGAQNVSQFPTGAHTGEIAGEMLKEFVTHVIIGHSERRREERESDDMLFQKVKMAKEAGLIVIYCVPGLDVPVPPEVEIIAYEPVFAIGSGNPDTPENANTIATAIKQKYTHATLLYGGSVIPENIASFTSQDALDGALVGTASLDAPTFLTLIQKA